MGGGRPSIVLGFAETPRAYFFAALGQASVWTGVLIGLAQGLGILLRVNWRIPMVLFTMMGIIWGCQWYYQAQQVAETRQAPPSWDEKNLFWRQVVAQVPHITPDSLLLFHCPNPALPAFYGRMIDFHAARLLYGADRLDLALTWYEYALHNRQALRFTPQQVIYEYAADMKNAGRGDLPYSYSQVVALGCWGDEVVLLDRFPEDLLAPAPADYNPYARLSNGFIPSDIAQLLAR